MKLHKALLIVATLSILAGLAGLVPMAYFWNKNRIALASAASNPTIVTLAPAPAPKPDLIFGRPTHITLTSVGIDLAVIDGLYNSTNQSWTLTNDKAQFMTPTVQPNNQSGNTLIYGHAQKQIFANLKKLKASDQAVLTTHNGHTFTYTYRSTEAVNPTDVGILSYEGKPQLTLQTCSGSFWQNRQFYYFDLTSVAKS